VTVSHAAEDRVLGGERQTDGLWVHKGRLSVGPPGSGPAVPGQSGDLNVNRGNGQGAIYFGGKSQYLYFDGIVWRFQPPLDGTAIADGSIGTADIAPNAVQSPIGQAFVTTAWSTTVVSSYVNTPLSVSVTTTGGMLRFEASMMMSHSVKSGAWLTGYSLDAVVQVNLSLVNSPDSNYLVPIAWVFYATPPAGTHTITVHALNQSAGTLTMVGGMTNCLWVTEQKR
jgi:hypothetical protein